MKSGLYPDPTIFVIFGAGGDLTWRKLVPALYNLFKDLGKKLSALGNEWDTRPNQIFYLALPPSLVGDVIKGLAAAGLNGDWCRIVVEKPFGSDLESARALNRRLGEVFKESQIFRIDHYLGKKTVQNILAFRLALAGCAVLHAHGKKAARKDFRSFHPVPDPHCPGRIQLGVAHLPAVPG
ncbi:glucose-6-phosphate dehydrogenase, NAD binding domain protein [delta proteobacterium NaphS2]|nr:glucose-6-phosphate dehydrogenase, NAD binding domain protein [delta proteobacterium NaphS2]